MLLNTCSSSSLHFSICGCFFNLSPGLFRSHNFSCTFVTFRIKFYDCDRFCCRMHSMIYWAVLVEMKCLHAVEVTSWACLAGPNEHMIMCLVLLYRRFDGAMELPIHTLNGGLVTQRQWPLFPTDDFCSSNFFITLWWTASNVFPINLHWNCSSKICVTNSFQTCNNFVCETNQWQVFKFFDNPK